MAENWILRSRVTTALSLITAIWLTGNTNFVPVTQAISLTLPSTGTKCVSEEIHSNVVVLADYYVIDEARPEQAPTISARVTSPYGNSLHQNDNVTHGRFAFTSNEAGMYLACFSVSDNQQHGPGLTLSLDWKIGISARDWDSVAKIEKIEGVELDLKRLEGVVQSIHENLIFLKHREAEMREVSEVTNSRVAWFSIMSLGVCIVVSALQIWHLKRFFRKKRLI